MVTHASDDLPRLARSWARRMLRAKYPVAPPPDLMRHAVHHVVWALADLAPDAPLPTPLRAALSDCLGKGSSTAIGFLGQALSNGKASLARDVLDHDLPLPEHLHPVLRTIVSSGYEVRVTPGVRALLLDIAHQTLSALGSYLPSGPGLARQAARQSRNDLCFSLFLMVYRHDLMGDMSHPAIPAWLDEIQSEANKSFSEKHDDWIASARRRSGLAQHAAERQVSYPVPSRL